MRASKWIAERTFIVMTGIPPTQTENDAVKLNGGYANLTKELPKRVIQYKRIVRKRSIEISGRNTYK